MPKGVTRSGITYRPSLIAIKEEEMADLDLSIMLKVIPTFNGNQSDTHHFLACCDTIYDTLNANARNTFILYLKTRLTGKAYEAMRYVGTDTYPKLRTEIRKQFLPERAMADIQTELTNACQGNEDILSFSNRVEKLLSELNSAGMLVAGEAAVNTVTTLNANLALQAFTNGLKDPIRLIIKASRFDTLRKAVNAALTEEKTGKYYDNHKNVASNYNKTKSNEICSYCKNIGHNIRNCRKRQFNNDRNTSSYNNSTNFEKRVPFQSNTSNSKAPENFPRQNAGTASPAQKFQ